MKIKQKIRNRIKSYFELYDIQDLEIGGQCGCCGVWLSNIIVSKLIPKMFRVGMCDSCQEKGNELELL